MSKRFALALLAAFSSGLVPACTHWGRSSECEPFISDCSNDVSIELVNVARDYWSAMPLTIEVCLDGDCQQAIVEDDSGTCLTTVPFLHCFSEKRGAVSLDFMLHRADTLTSVALKTTVSGEDGAALVFDERTVEIEAVEPNGPGCWPLCHQGKVSIEIP